MTPEEAQALEPGTTPGPWEWKDNCDKRLNVRDYDSLGNDTQHALETQDCEDYSSWVVASDEDKALIAAAPDMRATIAALRWEYGVIYEDEGEWPMVPGSWWPSRDAAIIIHRRMNLDGSAPAHRLVRRLVGPVEEAE